MARTVSIGAQDFAKLKSRDRFLVDKTSFIKEWWDNGDDVTLITRPRRFGKTLNLNMTERFFSNLYDDQEELFGDLEVWKDEEMRALAGQFPVISLSFASVKETSFPGVKEQIRWLLYELYSVHEYLLDSERITDRERNLYNQIQLDMSDTTATSALRTLSLLLRKHFGKNVILLLDEYDTPMQEAWVHGYWTELVEFTRNLFNASFKTNPALDRALMTGITRVSRESLFSDLNNLDVATITSEKYDTSFGFTGAEVDASLKEFGLSDKEEDVRFWYDGFAFGSTQGIYNPWSITQFLDKGGKLSPYWVNTSSNSLAGKLIREGSADLKKDFEILLSGGTVTARIDEEIAYDELEQNTDSIYSLLLATGYLKVLAMDDEIYTLTLTNHEVQRMFEKMIRRWFRESESAYNDFIKALLLGDVKWMNSFMNKIALQTISSFDAGNKPSPTEPERFYHGFVLGLMVDLKDRYHIRSNRESGFGRYDVVMEPRDRAADFAYILEFKTHDSDDEADLQATVRAALQQIDDRQYAADLIAQGIAPERIRKYGFAFQGKTVLIGEAE